MADRFVFLICESDLRSAMKQIEEVRSTLSTLAEQLEIGDEVDFVEGDDAMELMKQHYTLRTGLFGGFRLDRELAEQKIYDSWPSA